MSDSFAEAYPHAPRSYTPTEPIDTTNWKTRHENPHQACFRPAREEIWKVGVFDTQEMGTGVRVEVTGPGVTDRGESVAVKIGDRDHGDVHCNRETCLTLAKFFLKLGNTLK
jgi:hypothetical protein